MKKCLLLTVLMVSFAVANPSLVYADQEAQLKQLEDAVKTPPKLYGTRRIVMDNEAEVQDVAAPADCSALPQDVKSTAVDFSIQFKAGSAEIAPASRTTLQQIARILSLNPQRCILVEGHADATGNADRNMALSQERAASVAAFIAEKAGLERSRLVPIGKGVTEPIQNLDPRNPKNRRVVFKVVG